MSETTRYCRKCVASGVGLNSGYIIGDNFYANLELADAEANERGYSSFDAMSNDVAMDDIENENFGYYTEFGPDDVAYCIEHQGYYYLADGTKVEVD